MEKLVQISVFEELNLLREGIVLPAGVGLIKAETLLLGKTLEHPLSLLHSNSELLLSMYVDALVEICKFFFPKQVRFRFSDIKSSEAISLINGDEYEVLEPNPSLGNRGLHRLLTSRYLPLFKLEFNAAREVRKLGYTNLAICFPFVRSNAEFEASHYALGTSLLHDWKIWSMIEVPANLKDYNLLQNKFIDGFVLGTADLYQLLFAKDRDSSNVHSVKEDEMDLMIETILDFALRVKAFDKKVSIAGFPLLESESFRKAMINSDVEDVCYPVSFYLKYGEI